MNQDRDASVDRLLASALKARADAEPGAACLDAETAAAWADGALGAREAASVEVHAADCARCQALLAALVRATPPDMVEARSRWRFPAMGWLVPLTAAATALAIWVAVPRREPIQRSEPAESAVDRVAPAPAAAPPASELPPERANAKALAESTPQSQVAREQDAPAAPAASADRRERRDVASLDKNVPNPPAAPLSASADASLRREAAPAPARAAAFANRVEAVIVSSNPATRFRLLPGGGVQRSADAGATWRTEITGAVDTLTAGASPSPSVCWLIGPAGAVFLSTDGRSWRRLAFPEAVDLGAITAADSENATVTTADGRAFMTTDAGQTWARVPEF